jgi:hypothetical protein
MFILTGKKPTQVLFSHIPRVWNDPAYTWKPPPPLNTSPVYATKLLHEVTLQGIYPAIAYGLWGHGQLGTAKDILDFDIGTRLRIVLGVLSVSEHFNEGHEIWISKMGKFMCSDWHVKR